MLHKFNSFSYNYLGENMVKKIFNFLRKIIMSVLFIYAYNKLSLPLNIIIPLNVITVLLVTIFGIPSIFMLILFLIVCI